MAPTLAQQCRTAVRLLRTMPDELRHQLTERVATDVAEPLAGTVRGSATHPYGVRVTVKVRKGVEPQLTVGGRSKVFSGGASGNQVFYGAEFGGGTSKTWFTATSSRGRRFAVHRATTRQFLRPRPFLFPTFVEQADAVTEAWWAILDPILEAWAHGE